MKTEEQTLDKKIAELVAMLEDSSLNPKLCMVMGEVAGFAKKFRDEAKENHATIYRIIEALGGELSLDLKHVKSLRIGSVFMTENPMTDRIDFFTETPTTRDDE